MSKTKVFKRNIIEGMEMLMGRVMQLEDVLSSYIEMEGKTEEIKKRLEHEYQQREYKRSRRNSEASPK